MTLKTESDADEMPRLSLDNLANGAVRELFEQELDRVLSNIMDPNTDPEAKRAIRIEITFEPNAERDAARHHVEVTSKIAAFKGASGVAFLGRRRGQAIALVSNLRQTQLKWDEESAPRPLPSSPPPSSATGS